jgi:hypothetical protein
MKILIAAILMVSFNLHAKKKKKVDFKYKKFESFDFDALDVEGANSSPGDLSIGPRFKKKFKNKIPLKRNFNTEIKKAVDSIL